MQEGHVCILSLQILTSLFHTLYSCCLGLHREGSPGTREEVGAERAVRLGPCICGAQVQGDTQAVLAGHFFAESLEYLIVFFTISAAPFMRTCSSHPQKPFSNSTEKTDKKEKHSLKGSQKESIRFNYRPVLLWLARAQLTAKLPGSTCSAKSGGGMKQPCGLCYHFLAFSGFERRTSPAMIIQFGMNAFSGQSSATVDLFEIRTSIVTFYNVDRIMHRICQDPTTCK